MTIQDIQLSCQPSRVENVLRFNYTLTNQAKHDVYVLDNFPSVDPVSKQAIVNPNDAYVSLFEEGSVYVLKGIAPLPRHSVTVRIIPLGTKLPAGSSVVRSLSLPLPLAEQGPYSGDLPLRSYEQREVNKVIFGVQFIRTTQEGFIATPAEFGDDVYRVQTKATVHDAETLLCEFPTRSLFILTRKDDFVRMGPPHKSE